MLRQVRSLLTDPELQTLCAAPPDTLRRLGPAAGDAPFPLPESDGPRAQWRGGRAAGAWARRAGADLLHGHGLRRAPLYALAARRAGLPLVVTLHNLVPADTPAPVRAALRLALASARRVVAVSDAVAASAAGWVPDERLRVVRNGVDLAPFDDLPDRDDARRRLGWPAETPVVLCVARLAPEKGLDLLADAVRAGIARIVVAGEGPERARLEALGLELLGERDDVPLLMAAADLVCVPSRAEGLGLAAIEAMAAARPVVATRVGGLPEVVEDGVGGALTPAGDPEALTTALRALLADPGRAAAMGEAGRARARERFGLAPMRAATRAVYAEACG